MPPAFLQSASVIAFVTSWAKAGPVKASAKANTNVHTHVFMGILLTLVCGLKNLRLTPPFSRALVFERPPSAFRTDCAIARRTIHKAPVLVIHSEDDGRTSCPGRPCSIDCRHVHGLGQRFPRVVRAVRAFRQYDRVLLHNIIWNRFHEMLNAVQPRALLIDRLHDPPARFGNAGTFEHDLLGFGVSLPAPA